MAMNNILNTTCVLVRLNITRWTAVVKDKTASNENNERYKSLIKGDHLKTIQKTISKARLYHRINTLPWIVEGYRLLPALHFSDYLSAMKHFKDNYNFSVNLFLNKYDLIVKESLTYSNYAESEFPSLVVITNKFCFSFSFFPVPSPDNFIVNLDEMVLRELRFSINKLIIVAKQNILADLWERLYKLTKHLVLKLSYFNIPESQPNDSNKRGTKSGTKTFRNSTVDNLKEFVFILPRLNVFRDHNLSKFCEEIKNHLLPYDAVKLRENINIRVFLVKRGGEILSEMEAHMEDIKIPPTY